MDSKLLEKLDRRLNAVMEQKVPLSWIFDKLFEHMDEVVYVEIHCATVEIQGAHEYPDSWDDKSYNHILSHIECAEKRLGIGQGDI